MSWVIWLILAIWFCHEMYLVSKEEREARNAEAKRRRYEALDAQLKAIHAASNNQPYSSVRPSKGGPHVASKNQAEA